MQAFLEDEGPETGQQHRLGFKEVRSRGWAVVQAEGTERRGSLLGSSHISGLPKAGHKLPRSQTRKGRSVHSQHLPAWLM